jgi:hypothetical protein
MPFKKLKTEHIKNTDELIAQIEHKDRRFRVAQALFMSATLVALIIVISAQQRTLDSVKAQLVEQKSIAEAAAQQSDDQRDKIIRRLDCIVVFFTNPDRADLTIDDIDKCTLNRDESVQQFFQLPEPTESETPPDLTPSSGDPDPGAPQPTTPKPENPPQPIVPPVLPPSERPPIEVLGIPVCVPFTNVCIRQ